MSRRKQLNKQLNGSADEIEAAFYDAIGRADIDTLMSLWADDDEIICIHPGGPRLSGHAAIRASWESIFATGAMQLQATRIQTVQNLMCAMHNLVEIVSPSAHSEHDLHILATNIYLKTAEGWRIVCHHASVAPGKPPLDLPRAAILH